MNKGKELQAMVSAAKEASKISLKYFGKDSQVKHKGKNDLVTIADIECEKKIKELLTKDFLDYGFIGEETASKKQKGTYWVVDPIDGTNNFASNLPVFCHSIALVKDGKPIKAVVYDPIRKELFSAELNKGAYLNNKRMKVCSQDKISDCLIGMGYPYAGGERREKTTQSVINLLGNCLGVRRLGSATIDLCYLARGSFGGIFFYELQPWDVAAAMLIVQEAGGKVTDINGRQADIFANNFAASNKRIHKEFLSYLEGFDG